MIWLDVSTLLKWNRPAVGIIRVESECARYFLSKSDQVCFCKFDLRKKAFYRVDRQEVKNKLEEIRNGGDLEYLPNVPKKLNSKQKSEKLLEKMAFLIDLIPGPCQKKIYYFAKKRIPSFNALINSYDEFCKSCRLFFSPGSKYFPNSSIKYDVFDAIVFLKGDVYITVGSDWDHKDLKVTSLLKGKIRFSVLSICYDVIPVKNQQYFASEVRLKFLSYFIDMAHCSDLVLCISKSTERDYHEILGKENVPCPRTAVIELGCELPAFDENKLSESIQALKQKRFIMMVSTIERRKNHEILYRAYIRLLEKGLKDLPLMVFVGMPGWGVSDFLADLQFDTRVAEYIIVLNSITDNDLAWMYNRTLFTVFPSLYEGWGIPVAEGLAAGKFCLASNTSSLPEVGGDLAEYLDPWDLPAWTERLEWYFTHPDKVEERNERCRREYKMHTWNETARAILKYAESLQSDFN